jgi:DNA-binding CsgD family transcriptional regulator
MAQRGDSATSQIVGRDEPLALLEGFIDGLATGPGSLVIEGEAGIGKTTVWQAAVDAAVRRGYRVLVSRPAEAETGLAYSGLADLLAHADDSAVDDLPEPQRHALEIALLRSEAAGRAPAPRAIFTAFGGVLRALARDAPVLVAVDDRQWLDPGSLRALEFVSRRLADEPVGILATARPDGGRPWSAGNAVLRLGPLTPGALHRLIQAQTGVSLSRPSVLRVHRTTDGNPFFALEVAEVLLTAGLPEAGGTWPVPDDLREMVTARLGLLPAAVRSALLAAAASGRPTISGLDAAALEQAAKARIVTIGGHGRVRFAHPLFASAIYAGATPAERRRVHALLAGEARDPEEQARHRALACDGVDAEVAALLDRAASTAHARGAPDIAAELEERACALTPPDRPQDALERRLMAAEHHFHAGDLERARHLLVELVEGAASGRARSRALRLLGETYFRLGSVDDALRFLRRAADAAAGDPGSIARAELAFAFVLASSFGSFEEAGAGLRRALALAERLGDEALLSSALAGFVAGEQLLGRGVDEERLARALALEDAEASTFLERRPSMLAGCVYFQAEQFDRARVLLQGLRTRLVDRGEDSDLPDLLATLAKVECFCGNLRKAGELADAGYDLARQAHSNSPACHARAVRALVHAQAGEVDETRAAAADAFELGARSGLQIGAFWASVALGHLELSLGNDEAVVRTLAHSIELVERDGVVDPYRRPFLADAIEALVQLGDLERADRLSGLLEARARALDRRAAIVSAARCRALIGAARGHTKAALADLDRALAEGPTVPMPLELARALIVRGQLERRRKHKRESGESLRRALQMCEDIGARLWAQRARTELARLGRQADPAALTPTESQVARLAASGLTNREVAAAAFLSQKTVEANISRIYRKLGIHSRAELGARLAEQKVVSEPDSA